MHPHFVWLGIRLRFLKLASWQVQSTGKTFNIFTGTMWDTPLAQHKSQPRTGHTREPDSTHNELKRSHAQPSAGSPSGSAAPV